ncbi:MAG TPA: NAD(P)-dependent alcohol dehydrogenase [Steroidobacteraceae bacterium]|nr:NAD(P)-dependent alcohol dehydrogenase [Steroidobacteraceae bacterium]
MARKLKISRIILLVLIVAAGVFAFFLSHDAPCEAGAAPVSGAASMNAIAYRCYGGPEVLKLERVAKPVPAADEVLVHVRAAGVNPLDFHYMHGTPYIMRLGAGMGRPKDPSFGVDFAGVVEAVGADVKTFKPGDAVFGGRSGAFAEYLVVRAARNIVLKPENLSFEQAAAVPIAAVTALQALRDKGKVKAGQKVLVNGASGGVGTFAVQIAKHLGATVTGVCSTRNVEMVRGLGADLVVDYKTEDFVQRPERYDVIIDTVGNRDLTEYRHVLTPDGIYVMVGGPSDGNWIGPLSKGLKAAIYDPFVDPSFSMMLAELNPADLAYLRDLLAAGKLKPVLDRSYELADAAAAVAYVEEGHARGKVTLAID